MYLRQKYVRTKNNIIIVFPELMQHSEFKCFEPVSAGFVSIGVGDDGNPSISCYGESISLDLKSGPDDSLLAQRQIIGDIA